MPKHNERNIRQRGPGKWQLRIYSLSLGRRIIVTHPNLKQLIAKRDEIEADNLCAKIGAAPVLRFRPTLEKVLAGFEADLDRRELAGAIAAQTRATYGNQVRALKTWSEETGQAHAAAEEMRGQQIDAYCAWRRVNCLHKGKSRVLDGCIRNELGTLRQALRLADITPNWKAPRYLAPPQGKRILPARDFFRWLEAMEVGTLERTAAELAWRTAARPSDWIRFKWSDVDREAGLLRFDIRKLGYKQHAVPLTPPMLEHLDAWRNGRERADALRKAWHLSPDYQAHFREHILVIGNRKRPRTLNTNTLEGRFAKASKIAGIDPPIRAPGVLRNQFIAMALARGNEPYSVARHVAHSSLELLIRYAERHLPTDLIREMAGRLEERREVLLQEQ